MKTVAKIVFILFITITTLSAQEKVDLIGISFIHNPQVGLKDPATTQLGELDLNVTELDAFVKYPIKLKNEKTVIVNSINWHFVKAPFDDLPADQSFEANLHSLQYELTVRQNLSEKWIGILSARPTIASNFNNGINSDDFFFQGMVGIKYKQNQFMTYGAGVSYINGFGEPKTVPLLLFDYKTEHIKVGVVAPISASFKYQSNKVNYGFDVNLEGGQFNLGGSDGPMDNTNDTVKFSRYNIGPTIGWNFDKNSRFEVSAGISLNRILKAIDNNGVETDYDLENGLFFKTAFYFGK